MASLSRRNSHRDASAWPGWVDALSSLVMVVIFLLMIFVVAQFYLATALTGRDEQLTSLNRKVAELNELLTLERDANADLRVGIAQLSTELQASVATRDDMTAQLGTLQSQQDESARTLDERRRELASLQQDITQLREVRRRLEGELAEAHVTLSMTEQQRQALLGQLGSERDRSKALETELARTSSELAEKTDQLARETERTMLAQREIEQRTARIAELEGSLTGERAQSEEARRQVEFLNQQIAALRQQLTQIGAVLEVSEGRAREQQVQIAELGSRLNQALASKVQELARYRSEFFGRVREALGDRPDVSIVGDRFVFQSELLFPSGSAVLGGAGQDQLVELARTLMDVGQRIPSDINWVLRVDGHTDSRPINRNLYPSNWELSAARAISVVKYLTSQGLPPERLAAAGFGEFQPLDPGTSEEALARNRRIELKLDQR